jgi:cell division protease FtsH
MRTSSPGPPGRADAAQWRRWVFPAAIAAGFVTLLVMPRGAAPSMALSYTRFLADVSAGMVRAVTISPAGQVTGSLAGGHSFTTTIPVALGGNGLAGDLAAHHVQVTATTATSLSLLPVLIGLLPLLLFGGLLYLGIRKVPLSSGGGLGGLGGLAKAKARVIDAERPATRFTDVAGYAAVKTEISEVVDYLRDPGRYHRAGARGPRGVLMAGPPGTGKNLLARAVAGEAHVPFLSVSGSAFVEMFVGLGAARVRDLFVQARTSAPAIVFIDEIDALGARRDHSGMAGSDEREQTLNQLLAEMDGFDQSGGVVVLAATNRPDALDPALRRPGRFDREVIVPLPDRAERAAILASHARGKNLGPDADLDQVAAATPGFSGADLANLVNEAAVTAVRADRTTLTAADFDSARDRVLLGTRHSSPLAPGEFATVAVHEAGHALVATLAPRADPVSRVTVLGAGQALGLTEMLPADDRRLYGESYLADTLVVRLGRLGGRAAERLIRGEASTGAADDLASATALATQMVREFGLSEAVGPVSYSGPPAGYPALAGSRSYSEHTQWLVDQEVAALLTKAETRARDLLTSHREALAQLTAALLEQETVTGDQVRAIARASSPAVADDRPASARPGLSGPAADHDGEQPFLLRKLVDSAYHKEITVRHPRIIIASISLAAAAAIGGGITAAAATTSPASSRPAASQQAAATVRTVQATVGGKTETILINGQGLPLYYYLSDTAAKSVVTGGLAALWPPLTSASPAATGLTGKLTAVMDVHGDQIAYNGHLL